MEPLAPRSIRAVPQPLAVYLRPGYSHHTKVSELLASGVREALEGVIFDASLGERQEELRQDVIGRHIEAVLDTKIMELATPSGFDQLAGRRLPWAGESLHTRDRLRESSERAGILRSIVECVAAGKYTAVLAPTHFLESAEDPWLALDLEMTFSLRAELDRAGLREILIYYPLALPMKLFGDEALRAHLRVRLSTLPVDGIWFRIHSFGARSGAASVRRYIEACRDLHQQRPLVSEYVGTEALALLAFGAVGGVATGIASGEHFDAKVLLRCPKPRKAGFGIKRRIYISELQAYLPEDRAARFFETRGMKSLFACRDESCCRLGLQDMLGDPNGHFVKRRLGEVARLSRLSEPMRASRYLEETLRPATDKMVRAVKVEPSLDRQKIRLENLRIVLGALQESTVASTFSSVPRGHRIEIRKGA